MSILEIRLKMIFGWDSSILCYQFQILHSKQRLKGRQTWIKWTVIYIGKQKRLHRRLLRNMRLATSQLKTNQKNLNHSRNIGQPIGASNFLKQF